ncbi:MAG: hypothetical protein ACYDCF_06820 [Burkholderiales bacterium]
MKVRLVGLAAMLLLSGSANAWFFFFFPVPNHAKPTELQELIDALEKSDQTRAVAFVSEDKTFGGKRWVWGKYVGLVPQEEANQKALAICRSGLATAKEKTEGGKKLYDFGSKDCELYPFTPNDGPKKADLKREEDKAETKHLAEIEEAKKAAVEAERTRIAAEEEQKRLAVPEDERRREELEQAVAKVPAKDSSKAKPVHTPGVREVVASSELMIG